MVLSTRAYADKKGLAPLGRLVQWGVSGCDPTIMGIGPVPASRIALERAPHAVGQEADAGDCGDRDDQSQHQQAQFARPCVAPQHGQPQTPASGAAGGSGRGGWGSNIRAHGSSGQVPQSAGDRYLSLCTTG